MRLSRGVEHSCIYSMWVGNLGLDRLQLNTTCTLDSIVLLVEVSGTILQVFKRVVLARPVFNTKLLSYL
jgi:hypothetical protein